LISQTGGKAQICRSKQSQLCRIRGLPPGICALVTSAGSTVGMILADAARGLVAVFSRVGAFEIALAKSVANRLSHRPQLIGNPKSERTALDNNVLMVSPMGLMLIVASEKLAKPTIVATSTLSGYCVD